MLAQTSDEIAEEEKVFERNVKFSFIISWAVTRKPVFRVSDKVRFKQSPQLQRLARNFASIKSIYYTFQ